MSTYSTELLIVGGGPAGHAASLAASENGIENITVDNAPQDRLGATGLYGLRFDRVLSNSGGDDFLEPYTQHSTLTEGFDVAALETPGAVALHERVVPLLNYAALRQLGRTGLITGFVSQVALAPDTGGFVARTASGLTINAKELVVATGGCEVLLPELAQRDPAGTFTSKEVLAGLRDDDLLVSLEAHKQVVIVGNAHSAYSIAAWLRTTYPEHEVVLIQRTPTRPYFASAAEALQYGYVITDGDIVDVETGKINRFGGIRGVARAAWMRQHNARSPDTKLRDVRYGQGDGDIASLDDIGPDCTVIQAVGYSPVLPAFDGPTEFSHHPDGYGLLKLVGRRVLVLGMCGSQQNGTAVYYHQAQKFFQTITAAENDT